jgi:hypothetical protein
MTSGSHAELATPKAATNAMLAINLRMLFLCTLST